MIIFLQIDIMQWPNLNLRWKPFLSGYFWRHINKPIYKIIFKSKDWNITKIDEMNIL